MIKEWMGRFGKNRRGYYSTIIFLAIFLITLFAEIVANDKPLIVKHKGDYYFPIFSSYNETVFGGDFETPADYRDPYVKQLIENDGFAIFPLISYHYSTINFNSSSPAPSPPSKYNILGVDDNGRDVLARLIYGLRLSLIFGLTLTLITSVIGVTLGAMQGYFGGLLDIVFQRFMEIWSGLPVLFLLIILSSIIEPSFWILLGIMVLFGWMGLVGIVRAEFLKVRNYDFVKSAKSIGCSNARIIFRHILPNALTSTFAMLPFILSSSIITLTSLDFLGFGMPIEAPSLGELLAQGKNNISAYWLGVSGFMAVTIICVLLVFIGEAIRDSFNIHKN
jgi:microcin C transport system permease protein